MFALAITALFSQAIAAATDAPANPVSKISELAAKCSPQASCRGSWNGLTYHIVAPDTATFKASGTAKTSWAFTCKRDEFDDTESCTLIGQNDEDARENPRLFFVWTEGGRTPSISLLHYAREAYPGTSVVIRVDSNKALSVAEGDIFMGRSAESLIAQMKSGTEVKLRYFDWPYEYSHDGSLSLSGFSKIYAAVLELRAAAP